MRRRSALRVTVVLLALTGATGCRLDQLQFHVDKRLSFVSPAARRRATLPITVRWTMRDFRAVGLDGSSDKGRGEFAVFVDRAPMPAGKDLKWLARGDSSCKGDPHCPDPQYLADRGVYVTTATSVTLQILPRVTGVGDEQHYVNVVLLNGRGERLGESSWYRPFTTRRNGS